MVMSLKATNGRSRNKIRHSWHASEVVSQPPKFEHRAKSPEGNWDTNAGSVRVFRDGH